MWSSFVDLWISFKGPSYHKAPVSVFYSWPSDWPPVLQQTRDSGLSRRSSKWRLWGVGLCSLDLHQYHNCLPPLLLLMETENNTSWRCFHRKVFMNFYGLSIFKSHYQPVISYLTLSPSSHWHFISIKVNSLTVHRNYVWSALPLWYFLVRTYMLQS